MALPTACALEMIHTMTLIHGDLPGMDNEDAEGLVGGQVVDLASEGKSDISVESLNFIHTHKTDVLLEAWVVSGAMLAGAETSDIERLFRYAQNIGFIFQIAAIESPVKVADLEAIAQLLS